MDKARAMIYLSSAVESLGPVERGNLRYHRAVGTPVVCGPGNELVWADGEGAGCPVMLAAYRELPPGRLSDDGPGSPPLWLSQLFHRLNRAAGGHLLQVLAELSPDEVWEALGVGLE